MGEGRKNRGEGEGRRREDLKKGTTKGRVDRGYRGG